LRSEIAEKEDYIIQLENINDEKEDLIEK